MDQNYAEILVIVDKSGSMEHLATDTVGGINTFIEEQKKLPGKANLSVLLFDDKVSYWQSSTDLNAVPKFTREIYTQGGMNSTALYDAIGRGLNELGDRLNAMDEAAR